MNALEHYNQQQIQKLIDGKHILAFAPGDQLKIYVKIVDGITERLQVFEGVCIARKSRGIGSTFTVKKMSYGESVERIFQLYSPRIDRVEVLRRGKVRRAKLYYMRGLTGKAARIKEKVDYSKTKENIKQN